MALPPDPADVRLTQYSHGAGCGCKIAPDVLSRILAASGSAASFPSLLVGNDHADDAAVVRLRDDLAVVSTTDFFMPIVDDPFDFGRIAATNAISDVFAMGAEPAVAIAILGWPIERLDASVAAAVIAGGRTVCTAVGIPLAGGHSIDAPEPLFGLAVTGHVHPDHVKRNDGARAGDVLLLGKPLGIGILTTAEKKGLLDPEHRGLATEWMCRVNRLGAQLAEREDVHAMTDVTGFGLLGHLHEMCTGSGVRARIRAGDVPLLDEVGRYLEKDCVPGGTHRNLRAYQADVDGGEARERLLFADPQTSGGLLVSADPRSADELVALAKASPTPLVPIGEVLSQGAGESLITIAR